MRSHRRAPTPYGCAVSGWETQVHPCASAPSKSILVPELSGGPLGNELKLLRSVDRAETLEDELSTARRTFAFAVAHLSAHVRSPHVPKARPSTPLGGPALGQASSRWALPVVHEQGLDAERQHGAAELLACASAPSALGGDGADDDDVPASGLPPRLAHVAVCAMDAGGHLQQQELGQPWWAASPPCPFRRHAYASRSRTRVRVRVCAYA